MESIQVTTLEEGNCYDIPGLGNIVIVDYEIWTSDLDQPYNDYKGTLQVTHETLFVVKANISSSINAANAAKFTVFKGNVSQDDDDELEVAAVKENITDIEVLNICVKDMSIG